MTTLQKRKQQVKISDTGHWFYIIFYLQTTMVYYYDAVDCSPHSSKTKKSIYPIIADEGKVADLKLKTLIQSERKGKMGKNVNVLKLTKNTSLCSHYFLKEKLSTDGNPVFAWNNQENQLVWRRPERHRCAVPDECECCRLTHHVLQYSSGLYSHYLFLLFNLSDILTSSATTKTTPGMK